MKRTENQPCKLVPGSGQAWQNGCNEAAGTEGISEPVEGQRRETGKWHAHVGERAIAGRATSSRMCRVGNDTDTVVLW